MKIDKKYLIQFLRACLEEDLDEKGDITSDSLFVSNDTVTGTYIAKDSGVIAGLNVIEELFNLVNSDIQFSPDIPEGGRVSEGDQIASVQGAIKDLMKCERLSLNILQRLSGIASRVKLYVSAVEGTGVKIMDTRKTTPGMRLLEKYAVHVGGGINHRMGLYDQILVKDTHIGYLKKKGESLDIQHLRKKAGDSIRIEIEARTFEEVCESLEGLAPDIIMLDNMDNTEMARTSAYIKEKSPDTEIEASGGVTLDTVRSIAETGVDRISVGEITHSVSALDIGFYI